MSDLLVFCEQREGSVLPGSLGLLGAASRLAGELGVGCDAVVCGSGLDHAALAALGGHGARTVVVCDDPALGQALAQPIVDALAGVVGARAYGTVLFAGSVLAADSAAALAARLGAGVIVDAVELHVRDGRLVTLRPGLGDSVFAHCALRGDRGCVIMRAGTFAPGEGGGAAAPVEQVAASVQEWSAAARIVGHEAADTGGVDITQADILVGGGRGLGGADKFVLCEDLAKALGGEVAATRAVVDAGWYPYSAQVGQTGKTVSPKLYIAVGISGAIQHKVGMAGSDLIVAINKDGHAPIFDYADLGVVGDLNVVVPRLTALLRERAGG